MDANNVDVELNSVKGPMSSSMSQTYHSGGKLSLRTLCLIIFFKFTLCKKAMKMKILKNSRRMYFLSEIHTYNTTLIT